MDCSACRHPNPDDARFCGRCGAVLRPERRCPGCAAEIQLGQRFCHRCGAVLAADPAPAPEPPPEPDGERKQVTVLFADVKGSMDLAVEVGIEDWREIMQRLFAILAAGVERFGGTVDKFTGDGIMALFGAPVAQEDHARRACHAALHLRGELAAYAAELRRERGLSFSVRMGLNSGEAVVGELHERGAAYTAVGHTVGLAQRMEQLAEPGTAYLTQSTAELVAGELALRDLGPVHVKGVAEPIRCHRLEGAGHRGRPRDAQSSRLVGRADELQLVAGALSEGGGRAIVVVGEAGLGKSRLCREAVDRFRGEGADVYEARAVAHGQAVPFLTVLELLRSYFGITDEDSDRAARDRIAGRLLQLDEAFRDDLPLLFDFLGVADAAAAVPQINDEARQRRLLGAVRRLLHAPGRRGPVVLVLEDLHWLDAGSEAFLGSLVDALPGTPTVLLANFRPEYRAAWLDRSYVRRIALQPLGTEAVDCLLSELLGDDRSLDGLAATVRRRTAGNPFFVEEIVRDLAERGVLSGVPGHYRLARHADEPALPPTVQATIAARIDRLPAREREVLRTAAVLGGDFVEPVLRRMSRLSEDELESALATLVAAELLHARVTYPVAEYRFAHPLVAEVGYRSQLTAWRTRAHAAAADAIAELEAERLDERAALVAHHRERAGQPLEAARWSARAAGWAGAVHPREALTHWQRARALAAQAPASDEALPLRLLAATQVLNFGWRVGLDHRAQDEVFREGCELAEAAGQPAALAHLHLVYGAARGFAGDLQAALAHAERAAHAADRVGDPELDVVVRFTSYWHSLAGDLRRALEEAQAVVAATRDDVMRGARFLNLSPHIWLRMYSGSFLLPWTGRVREGAAELDAAVRLAHEHDEVETLGWALGAYGSVAWVAGSPPDMDRTRRGVEIAERLGSTLSRCLAAVTLCRAHLVREEWDDAREVVETALRLARERHLGLQLEPTMMAHVGEARLGAGDSESALALADAAAALAAERGMRHVAAQARLTVATARLRTGALAGVREELREVMRLADETGAVLLEPMARTQLAELSLASDDPAGAEAEFRRAQALFERFGAGGRAAATAGRLRAAAGAPR